MLTTVATQTLLEDQVIHGADSDVETSDINNIIDTSDISNVIDCRNSLWLIQLDNKKERRRRKKDMLLLLLKEIIK